jgi:hypothetical protein
MDQAYRYTLHQEKLLLLYALDKLGDRELAGLVTVPYGSLDIARASRNRARAYLSSVAHLSSEMLDDLNREAPLVLVRITRAPQPTYAVDFFDRPDGRPFDPWAFVFAEYLVDVCANEECRRIFVPAKRSMPKTCSAEHYYLSRDAFPDVRANRRNRRESP